MFSLKSRARPEFTVCGSHAEAQALCADAYDDDAIAAAVAARTAVAVNGDLAPLGPFQGEHVFLGVTFAAARASNLPLRVLDFGGACGHHAIHALRTMAHVPQRWAVVETAAMLRHTARFESDRLRFFDSVAAAGEWLGGVDLVHTSSTVQYTPAPLATVAVLRSLAAPVVLYQRTALSDGATFHAVQRAPLANHGSARERSGSGETLLPITWLDRGAFLGAASSGYDLVVRFAGRPAKIAGRDATFGETFLFQRPAGAVTPGSRAGKAPRIP